MKEQRQDSILKMIEKTEFVTVGEIASALYVSLPTVRRDLAELEKRGLITRSHGGAAKSKNEQTPFDFRTGAKQDVKRRMCKAAASLIEEGQTIFIDGSTSCLHIADFIKDIKRLTVVTNGLTAMAMLSKLDIDCYLTGGKLIKRSLCFTGRRAEQFVSDFRFDMMFFSSSALNNDKSITDWSQPETELRRTIMERSEKKIFLCDSSKFSKSDTFFVETLDNVDIMITDRITDFEVESIIV